MKNLLILFLTLNICICSAIAHNYPDGQKPERIYLHTDRNVYMAGELLFYAAYLQGNTDRLSKFAYLVLRGQPNSMISVSRLALSGQMAYGSIYLPDTLRSGIYQLVCYTNSMRNNGEEFFFRKEVLITNRFDEEQAWLTDSSPENYPDTPAIQSPDNINPDVKLIIQLDKKVFKPREKIDFFIETKSIPENAFTHLSVSISEVVPGIPVERSISQHFGEQYNLRNNGLNPNHIQYIPETNGIVLQGRILSPQQNQYYRNAIHTVFVSCIDSLVNLQYTYTDSLGSFSFPLNSYYDDKELFISIKDQQAFIEPDNKFNLIQPYTSSGLFNKGIIRNYLARSRNITEVNRNYGIQAKINTQKEFPSSKTIPRVYYKSNSTVIPADYIELPDFIEISRELLPELRIRKNNKNYTLNFTPSLNREQGDSVPALFLDGVLIQDVNQIINLGSADIKRIEILPFVRYFGEISFAGILSVFSKDLKMNTVQLKKPTVRYQSLSSQPYTKPVHFDPLNTNRHIPDLRQVLLWEPDILLKYEQRRKIEFYASDLQGKYRINIQGITSSGIPLNYSEIITIQIN